MVLTMNKTIYTSGNDQYIITSDLHPLVGIYTPANDEIEIRLWNQVKRIAVSSESDAEKAFNHTVWSVMLWFI